jgi:hypothetical protein
MGLLMTLMNGAQWLTLSKALEGSKAYKLTVLPPTVKCSVFERTVNVACLQPRPFLKPHWLSLFKREF